MAACTIYTDRVTGVNCLCISNTAGCGLTTLLDAYGKVVVSALPMEEQA